MKKDIKNIDQHIIGYLTHDISDADLQTLNSWKNESQENKDEFDNFVDAWSKSEKIKLFDQIDLEKDWDCVCKKIKSKQQQPKDHRKSFRISIQKVAAIFIPFLFISVAGILYWNVPGFGRLTAYETHQKIQRIDLPDGSFVTLNTNSKLIIENNIATASERNVKLDGEAFFEVNHNKTSFEVTVDESIIRVLGTEFNINKNTDNISVSVISGKVNVSSNNSQVDLTKGERAVIKDGKLIEEIVVTENDIYWCSKQLKFKQATLSDICKVLQKNFKQIKTVKFTTKEANTKVTTTFKNQSLNDILDELKVHFSKKITFDGSTLTVSD